MTTTLAQISRERRDIVSGEVMEEARLIRFVAGPEGVVTPDLARRLPGRGLWVAADRVSVETAARKSLFSRAAKARLAAPADLAGQVEALLMRRLLSSLGLARKAGELTFGFEKVLAAVRSSRAALIVEASDGASDGRRKILAASRKLSSPPRLIGLYTGAELDLALGAENVIHTAFLAGRGADRWTFDVQRLSGFRPLFPESWREEP
ncbi:MAG TPA: RNA-binding protein [Caulobacteraceae bacterium]|nr:RNA-binding protein [Caulobacteraceae bacterium]